MGPSYETSQLDDTSYTPPLGIYEAKDLAPQSFGYELLPASINENVGKVACDLALCAASSLEDPPSTGGAARQESTFDPYLGPQPSFAESVGSHGPPLAFSAANTVPLTPVWDASYFDICALHRAPDLELQIPGHILSLSPHTPVFCVCRMQSCGFVCLSLPELT